MAAQAQKTKGKGRLKVVAEVGTPVNMDMRVAGVHNSSVSAGDVKDRGHVVVLRCGSVVTHDPTDRSTG